MSEHNMLRRGLQTHLMHVRTNGFCSKLVLLSTHICASDSETERSEVISIDNTQAIRDEREPVLAGSQCPLGFANREETRTDRAQRASSMTTAVVADCQFRTQDMEPVDGDQCTCQRVRLTNAKLQM